MNFAGPGKLDIELQEAVKAGATISVESEGEAVRAIRAAERVGIQPRISVRVTPPFTIESRPREPGQHCEPVRNTPNAFPRSSRDCWKPGSIGAACTCLPARNA